MADLRKYFGSKKKLAQTAALVAIVCVVGWWVNARIKAAEARKFKPASEVARIEYAVANTRSWHLSLQGTMREQPFETEQDVVCPYQSHTVTQTRSSTGAKVLISEIIETQDRMYAREGNEPWASEPKAGTQKCRTGPMAGPSTLLATLAGLETATAIRGELLQAGNESCRVWNFIGNSSQALLATLCVNDTTHLPYELKQGSLDVRYRDWNMPILISAPTADETQTAPM